MLKWLLLIFAILQAPGLFQAGRGVVTGKIRDTRGQAVAAAPVIVVMGSYKDGRISIVPLAVSVPGTMAKTDDNGNYRLENIPPGRYYILAQPVGRSNGEVPTLYPGATKIDDAKTVEIGADSNAGGIDFAIQQSHLVSVSGRVFNTMRGMPSGAASVNLTGGLLASFRTMTRDNGTFSFENVAPGDYVAWASEENRGPARTFSTKRITVGEQGLSNLELLFKPPVSVRGRVIIEGGRGFANPQTAPGITANLVEGTFGSGTTALMDGSFQFGRLPGTGLVDGEYRLTVDRLPGDYYVKSMTFGTSDLLSDTLRISENPSSEIAITLASGTSVPGTVRDDKGSAAPYNVVYLIPRTVGQKYLARKISTDQNGNFIIHGVAPGEYTAFAVANPLIGTVRPFASADINKNSAFPAGNPFAGSEQDPEFTREYEPRGMGITVTAQPYSQLTLPVLR